MPLNKDGIMVILSSPSGAGKTTLVKLLSKNKDFHISISHTTRKLRAGEIQDKDYDDVMDINFRSAFIFMREFARDMVKGKWGRIVNVGSSSSYFGHGETSLYCASKHALLGLSRSIHDELKQYNVRTFCISPSSTQSKMGLATKDQDYSTFLDPNDVAKYVIFAISHDSNIVSEEIFLKRMIIQ